MSNNASFHTFHKCSAIKSKQTRIKKWSQSRRRIKSKLTWFSPICYCVTLILLQHFLQNFLLQLSAQVLALIQEYLSNPRLCMFFFSVVLNVILCSHENTAYLLSDMEQVSMEHFQMILRISKWYCIAQHYAYQSVQYLQWNSE